MGKKLTAKQKAARTAVREAARRVIREMDELKRWKDADLFDAYFHFECIREERRPHWPRLIHHVSKAFVHYCTRAA